MSTIPLGYVIRAVTLGSLVGGTSHTFDQRGYGFEIVAGAQYIDVIRPVLLRDAQVDEDPAEFGTLYDGARFPCPGGFIGVYVKARSDVPAASGIARIVLKIWTVPALLSVADSGLGAKASVGLLNSSLHPDVGDTMHVNVPAGSQLLVHDDVAGGYQQSAPLSGGFARSRTIGDEARPWWPTHSLYFYGFVATNCPAANAIVDILAYLVDGNGASVLVPYWRLQATGTQITVGYTTLYANGGLDLNVVIHLSDLNNRPSLRIPYPLNGCRIYLRNQDVSDHAFAGILGVSSA